ncbi:hypothetical protein NDU88_001959 [Pleurodeles waltl]|uniref:Uncharacterized protein n=1 Tax=Pleurodeles waltl TaxID=8319 RepID=A0AAV7LEM2_PLEWA|nr:hypothetical protein NDU88_001959 [Pleurodeles waltl]
MQFRRTIRVLGKHQELRKITVVWRSKGTIDLQALMSSSENASGSRKNTGKKTEEIPYVRLLKMRVAPERIPARKQKKYPTVSI